MSIRAQERGCFGWHKFFGPEKISRRQKKNTKEMGPLLWDFDMKTFRVALLAFSHSMYAGSGPSEVLSMKPTCMCTSFIYGWFIPCSLNSLFCPLSYPWFIPFIFSSPSCTWIFSCIFIPPSCSCPIMFSSCSSSDRAKRFCSSRFPCSCIPPLFRLGNLLHQVHPTAPGLYPLPLLAPLGQQVGVGDFFPEDILNWW